MLYTVLAMAGPCERGNEPSEYMKGGEHIYQLRGYQVLKMTQLL
jgi:hypothetical protein